MPVIDGKRLPCAKCGRRLYYHEQREAYCNRCAAIMNVDRKCDPVLN